LKRFNNSPSLRSTPKKSALNLNLATTISWWLFRAKNEKPRTMRGKNYNHSAGYFTIFDSVKRQQKRQ